MSTVTDFDRASFPAPAEAHPRTFRFDHPADVLNDTALSRDEKRAILSAWASDAWAIPSTPGLRWPLGLTQPVAVEVILVALKRLDEPPPPRPGGASMRLQRQERYRRRLRNRLGHMTRRYLERHFFKPPDTLSQSARAA